MPKKENYPVDHPDLMERYHPQQAKMIELDKKDRQQGIRGIITALISIALIPLFPNNLGCVVGLVMSAYSWRRCSWCSTPPGCWGKRLSLIAFIICALATLPMVLKRFA